MYHIFNRPDLGQPLVNKAREKDSQHPSVSLIYCQYLISSGHFEEARELWLRAKDTTDPMAQSFLKEPDFQKGIELLEHHINPTPE
jgi:hypothetical protein